MPTPETTPLAVAPVADFPARLAAAVGATGAPLCVGLDPDPARLPPAVSLSDFCVAITEAAAPFAAAFKPNLAFFEAAGLAGWRALEEVCAAVRATGRLLVLDAKRGDIDSTAARYAAALFDHLGGDAATVSPYLGRDSLTPFFQHEGRCSFVLAATSNPGASDLQALDVGGEPLYRHVARLAVETGRGLPGTVGLVVGGTRPALLADLREAHPDTPFLVPGIGAQGGSISDVLAANAGGPLLVNASRSILYASPGPDFARAAAAEAARLAEALRG